LAWMQSDELVGTVAEPYRTSVRLSSLPPGAQTRYITFTDLQRFVDAQDDHDTFALALDEMAAGRKRSHWMSFVLPQLAGLGMSDKARFLDRACDYTRSER